jgi:hypothetical protein
VGRLPTFTFFRDGGGCCCGYPIRRPRYQMFPSEAPRDEPRWEAGQEFVVIPQQRRVGDAGVRSRAIGRWRTGSQAAPTASVGIAIGACAIRARATPISSLSNGAPVRPCAARMPKVWPVSCTSGRGQARLHRFRLATPAPSRADERQETRPAAGCRTGPRRA